MLIFMTILDDEQKNVVDKLYKEYYGLFYSVAYKVLNSKTAAEDAVHNAFIKIQEKVNLISQLDSPRMRSYCIVIVERTALYSIRSEKKYLYVEEFDDVQSASTPDPESITLDIVEQEEVKKLISELPDDDKEIIFLHFYEGQGYQEIADYYGISVEAAKKRGQRAISKLRKMIN